MGRILVFFTSSSQVTCLDHFRVDEGKNVIINKADEGLVDVICLAKNEKSGVSKMAETKYPPGYAEEFETTARLYTLRRMALYEEHLKNGTSDDEYLKVRFANRDEMFEKLHQIRAKYGVPDPTSEDER